MQWYIHGNGECVSIIERGMCGGGGCGGGVVREGVQLVDSIHGGRVGCREDMHVVHVRSTCT